MDLFRRNTNTHITGLSFSRISFMDARVQCKLWGHLQKTLLDLSAPGFLCEAGFLLPDPRITLLTRPRSEPGLSGVKEKPTQHQIRGLVP